MANVLYLVFSYLGGLWTGPHDLPSVAKTLSPFVPTRQWGDVLWPAALGTPWRVEHWLALLAWSLVFAAVATWGYRRDEGQRFR